jgi:hypothetical protein
MVVATAIGESVVYCAVAGKDMGSNGNFMGLVTVVVIEVEGTAQSSDRNYFTLRYRPPALHSRRAVGNASPAWTCLRVPEIPPQPIAGTVAL